MLEKRKILIMLRAEKWLDMALDTIIQTGVADDVSGGRREEPHSLKSALGVKNEDNSSEDSGSVSSVRRRRCAKADIHTEEQQPAGSTEKRKQAKIKPAIAKVNWNAPLKNPRAVDGRRFPRGNGLVGKKGRQNVLAGRQLWTGSIPANTKKTSAKPFKSQVFSPTNARGQIAMKIVPSSKRAVLKPAPRARTGGGSIRGSETRVTTNAPHPARRTTTSSQPLKRAISSGTRNQAAMTAKLSNRQPSGAFDVRGSGPKRTLANNMNAATRAKITASVAAKRKVASPNIQKRGNTGLLMRNTARTERTKSHQFTKQSFRSAGQGLQRNSKVITRNPSNVWKQTSGMTTNPSNVWKQTSGMTAFATTGKAQRSAMFNDGAQVSSVNSFNTKRTTANPVNVWKHTSGATVILKSGRTAGNPANVWKQTSGTTVIANRGQGQSSAASNFGAQVSSISKRTASNKGVPRQQLLKRQIVASKLVSGKFAKKNVAASAPRLNAAVMATSSKGGGKRAVQKPVFSLAIRPNFMQRATKTFSSNRRPANAVSGRFSNRVVPSISNRTTQPARTVKKPAQAVNRKKAHSEDLRKKVKVTAVTSKFGMGRGAGQAMANDRPDVAPRKAYSSVADTLTSASKRKIAGGKGAGKGVTKAIPSKRDCGPRFLADPARDIYPSMGKQGRPLAYSNSRNHSPIRPLAAARPGRKREFNPYEDIRDNEPERRQKSKRVRSDSPVVVRTGSDGWQRIDTNDDNDAKKPKNACDRIESKSGRNQGSSSSLGFSVSGKGQGGVHKRSKSRSGELGGTSASSAGGSKVRDQRGGKMARQSRAGNQGADDAYSRARGGILAKGGGKHGRAEQNYTIGKSFRRR